MECNCEILNITEKQDVSLLLRLLVGYKKEEQTGEPFPIELAEDVAVQMVSERGERVAVDFTVGDAGRVLLRLKGADFRAGVYGVDVTCRLNGAAHRAYGDSVIRYTFATVKGADSVTVVADPYEVTLYVGYVTDIVPKRTSELLNDGEDGSSPFATLAQVAELSDKFFVVKVTADIPNNRYVTDKTFEEMRVAVGKGLLPVLVYNGVYHFRGVTGTGGDVFFTFGHQNRYMYLFSWSEGIYPTYSYLSLSAMTDLQAAAGTDTVARTISPAVLKGAILTHVAPGLAAKQDKLIAGEGIEIDSDGKTISAIGTSDDIYVVHIRPDGSNFTLVEPVQEVFAARDAGKTLIGIVEGVRQGGVLNYLPINDGVAEIPLACVCEVSPGRMIYYVYTIYDEDGRIVKESIAFDLGKMTAAEAEAGNLTTARTIAPSTLKSAILYHTSDLVNGGAYNSTSKKIELKHGSTVVAEIDAAPFIVDGMVDDVRIENGSLVIDFNTASGKQDIEIPLTEIFNPNNYYTKQQTDGLLSGKASTADVTALQQQVAGKQDTIQDLAEIRAGAAAGATAVQPAALQPYATEQWVGEQGFLTEHQDISGKEDKMQILQSPIIPGLQFIATLGVYYRFPDSLNTFSITLPTPDEETTVQTIVFYMTMGSAPAVTFTSEQPIYYHDGFSLEAGKTYEVNALWNGAAWVVASVEIVVN